MSSKEEILQSKGGGELLYICLEKLDGERQGIMDSLQGIQFSKEYVFQGSDIAEKGSWWIVVYLLGDI
eukprot:5929765-Ditylum_brightwellii.AAC.1